ncbi:MAG TPA: hypothetical protein PLZ05_01530 [Alphaproteobacteria bacterium]|nr:hypothetical protein [Alphaproteobacteria bacterium]
MNKQSWFVVVCVLLGIALLPLPYGYYQFLRWVVCGVSVYVLINQYNKKSDLSFGLIISAILYNPISTIHLDKIIWSVINIITIFYFIHLINNSNKKNAE